MPSSVCARVSHAGTPLAFAPAPAADAASAAALDEEDDADEEDDVSMAVDPEVVDGRMEKECERVSMRVHDEDGCREHTSHYVIAVEHQRVMRL